MDQSLQTNWAYNPWWTTSLCCEGSGANSALEWPVVDYASGLRRCTHEESNMLYYAAVFFVIAVIAAVLGFTGIAAGAAQIAKILFFIFLVIFIVTLVLGVRKRP